MRILVTGATGNIGTSVVKVLAERGHQVRATLFGRARGLDPVFKHPRVECFRCDVRDAGRVNEAVRDQDAIIHLAYVLPPYSDEDPELARTVNLDGTRNIVDAAARQVIAPRFFFASTFDLFGRTMDQPPPRRLSDPIQVTDTYTDHKLTCEQWIQELPLDWCIFRFSDIPVIGYRAPHPIMYEIPLEQRFEVLHTLDAGVAIANALECDDVWRRIWLVGGGNACQLTYREYLFGLLSAMGIGALPEQAFTKRPYVTDWLDTADSEALLHYQRHTFHDIVRDVAARSRLQRRLVPMVRPLVQRFLLRMSPYMK